MVVLTLGLRSSARHHAWVARAVVWRHRGTTTCFTGCGWARGGGGGCGEFGAEVYFGRGGADADSGGRGREGGNGLGYHRELCSGLQPRRVLEKRGYYIGTSVIKYV